MGGDVVGYYRYACAVEQVDPRDNGDSGKEISIPR